jgi:hypothetical protein
LGARSIPASWGKAGANTRPPWRACWEPRQADRPNRRQRTILTCASMSLCKSSACFADPRLDTLCSGCKCFVFEEARKTWSVSPLFR